MRHARPSELLERIDALRAGAADRDNWGLLDHSPVLNRSEIG